MRIASRCQQCAHAHQVERAKRDVRELLNLPPTDDPCPSQAAKLFEPSKDLFIEFAFLLTHLTILLALPVLISPARHFAFVIFAGNFDLILRLELARALAIEPSVLLLDEIAGGLTEMEVHELVATIKLIRTTGITLIWIEHIVHALLEVVDQLLAIDYGRVLMCGDPKSVMASPEVQSIYLGNE